jgi:all-trans-retinol 13,14-reductase
MALKEDDMNRLLLWLLTITVAVLLVGCGGDNDDDDANKSDDDTGGDDDTGDDSSPVDAISSATPGVNSAILTESHEGWKKADCASCHTDAHDQGYARGECSSCHGSNGAPTRASGHANSSCTDCHAEAHAESDFRSPSDCRMCHGYENVTAPECPSTESFDVVVIGAGGGGLATAAKLARNGMSVAVLEQSFRVGGCMGMIRRGVYNMEIGLHALDGLDPPDGMNRKTFEDLGILDKITPVKLDPMYVASFPEHQIVVPADVEEYRQALKSTFPDEATNIDRLWDDLADYDLVFNAINNLTASFSVKDLITIITHAGVALRLLELKDRTLSDMLADYTSNQQLVAIWSQLALFLGVEPNRLSALMFTVMWNNYHRHGYYYFEGGSGSIADAIAQVVEENGGTIRLGARATKIDIVDGQATLVRTQDDGCFAARYIVSNANAPDTIKNMVGSEYFPADYLSAMDNMTIGLSTFTVYLGVDHDYGEIFGGSHEIMFSTTYDTDENMGYIWDGDIDRAPGAVGNYSVVDPLAAPTGKNSIQLISQLPYDWQGDWHWSESYDDYVDLKTETAWRLIARAEKYLPGLSKHIEVMEVGTPRTVEGYTLNPRGTIFGWDHTIDQSLDRRLKNQTPIDNLYLAGAWTFPGAGQSAVIQSGAMVAGMILEHEGR